jgi:hypothetical protein
MNKRINFPEDEISLKELIGLTKSLLEKLENK